MALDDIRELQLRTLLNAVRSDSSVRGSQFNEAVDRMVTVHGEAFRQELKQRMARERPLSGRSPWDMSPVDRRPMATERYARNDDFDGSISFRQATRGSTLSSGGGRSRADDYDERLSYSGGGRFSPPRDLDARFSSSDSFRGSEGRDPYAGRSVPRDGESWFRNNSGRGGGGRGGGGGGAVGGGSRGGGGRDNFSRQRRGHGDEQPDPRIAGTALSGLKMSPDGNLVLPQRHIQRGVVLVYPSQPGDVLPPVGKRPGDCVTAFVGGLPPRCRDHHLRDAFGDCGEIKTIRLKPRSHLCKTFAHIEYDDPEAVDRAVAMSGWYIKVDRTRQAEAVGRLKVDYAITTKKSSKDGEVTPAKKRSRSESAGNRDAEAGPQAKRKKRDKRQIDADDDEDDEDDDDEEQEEQGTGGRRPLPSPSSLTCSEASMAELIERFEKPDNTVNLEPYLKLVSQWFQDGECTEDSRDSMFSLLQAILGTYMRRLCGAKVRAQEKVEAARLSAERRLRFIGRHVVSCGSLVAAVQDESVSERFSKAQQKNLDMWLSSFQGMKAETEEEMLMNLLEAGSLSTGAAIEQCDAESLSPEEHVTYLQGVQESLESSVKHSRAKMAKLKHNCRQLLSKKNDEIMELRRQLDASVRDSKATSTSSETDTTQAQQRASGNGQDERGTVSETFTLSEPACKLDYGGDEDDDADEQSKKDSSSLSLLSKKRPRLNWVEETAFLSDDEGAGAGEGQDTNSDQAVIDEEQLSLFADDNEDDEDVTADQDMENMMILLDADGEVEAGKTATTTSSGLSNEAAAVVAVVSSFLMIQPFGATAEEITSYLKSIGCSVPADSIHSILKQCSLVFNSDEGNGDDGLERYHMSAFQTIGLPLQQLQ